MYLQSKLTAVFAALLAFADTNENLDLATEETPWKRQLWIDLFSDSKITFYPYTEIQSIAQKIELSHVPVAQTGFGNCRFKAHLPFSWIIKTKIEQILHESKASGGKEVAWFYNFLNIIY